MINQHIDAAVEALYEYYRAHNQLNEWPSRTPPEQVQAARINAQKMFARVDWVEKEVDKRTIEVKYLEMVYQAGRRCGMLASDEMTEAELKLFGVFDDLN